MPCEHLNFQANVEVARITDGDHGPVYTFNAAIRIKCADCGADFMFPGLPRGINLNEPVAGVGGIEARLPIRQFDRDRDMGQGETMRVVIPHQKDNHETSHP